MYIMPDCMPSATCERLTAIALIESRTVMSRTLACMCSSWNAGSCVSDDIVLRASSSRDRSSSPMLRHKAWATANPAVWPPLPTSVTEPRNAFRRLHNDKATGRVALRVVYALSSLYVPAARHHRATGRGTESVPRSIRRIWIHTSQPGTSFMSFFSRSSDARSRRYASRSASARSSGAK